MFKFFHGLGKMPTLQQQRQEELAKAKQENFELALQLEACIHGIAMRDERIARLEQEMADEKA